MRINNFDSFQNIKTNNSETSQKTQATSPKASELENLTQQMRNGTDMRASMRSSEMGINARMLASNLQKATDTSLKDITDNLSTYLQANNTDKKPKSMAELFGIDAFQHDLNGNDKRTAARGKKRTLQWTRNRCYSS